MLFSKTDSRSTLQYLASLVTEGVERYNAQHPEDQVGITARSRIKTADENSFEFLRGVMDNREAGNEMRDIVSMISELDRLDEELRLASDIQVNMLPMIFPPFPERTEFDLYASMTPAKEVGGDFYDFFLTDSAMEMFGEDRLVSTLNRNRDTQPKEVIAHMREAVDAFADGAPQFDDVAMLCLKYLGRRED